MKIGLGVAALLGLPPVAFAQGVSISNFTPPPDKKLVIGTDYLSTLAGVINLFLLVAGIAALIAAFYGGFLYLTSAGNAASAAKGRNAIVYAIIGIVIITLSFVLVGRLVKVPACDTASTNVSNCLNQK